MLIGITDIGSNSIRLNVYRYENNNINILFSKKETIGLVNYIKEGQLTHKGIRKLITVLMDIKKVLDQLNIEDYHFFSTASLRNIQNSPQVLLIIQNEVNIEIDILSGEEEGEFSFCGSKSTLKNEDGILIDLGGGSVEIVLFNNKIIIQTVSIPVGSLKMFNEYIHEMIPNEEERKLIRDRVHNELEKTGLKMGKIPFLCGVGGSIRTIGKLLVDLDLKKKKIDLIDAHLLMVLNDELKKDKNVYKKILHVKPSRIHTLVPSLIILEAVCSYFGCEIIQISKYSVREGYLYKKLLNLC